MSGLVQNELITSMHANRFISEAMCRGEFPLTSLDPRSPPAQTKACRTSVCCVITAKCMALWGEQNVNHSRENTERKAVGHSTTEMQASCSSSICHLLTQVGLSHLRKPPPQLLISFTLQLFSLLSITFETIVTVLSIKLR